jgi:PAS domain S-box-containing protein
VPDRILVVEDNTALADNIAELLAGEELDVVLAVNAEAALRSASERGFDLALVDIGLGGKETGLDLLPKLRRISPNSEILLMTGNATLQTAIQAIRSGVYAYVQKPFESEQFTGLVNRALAQVVLKREKQALAQRLAASEALYRGLVDTAEACILGLDEQGVIRFANRFAGERLAQAQGELVGRSLFTLAEPTSEATLRRALGGALRGSSERDLEVRHRAPPRIVRWTFTPLASHLEGRSVSEDVDASVVLAVGIDLTDRLALERKNAEGEAMAAMGTLATSLAHEIRNPLNAARLQLELLLRRAAKSQDPATEVLTTPAKHVQAELERLRSLLDEFLSLARPRQLVRERQRVADLLQAVAELKAPLAQSLGVSLQLEVADPELEIRADADKLKQVLINLVGNALEALQAHERPAKRVELEAHAEQDGVLISVADNGPGIAPEVARDAFRPFVTSKQGGTGLGLAIVQKIVAQHGGRAELVPREGGGTIARFFIPA